MRALLLAALLLAPLALADHDYSHRYVVEGRLVGADGAPLAGRTVAMEVEREELSLPCSDGAQKPVTDEWGDFRFCYHKHNVTRGATITLRAGNVSSQRVIDEATRQSVFLLHEPNETGVAPAKWNESYRIAGKAWRATGPAEREGVAVLGEAVPGVEVNVTVRTAEGESGFVTRTDAFGDYDVVIETPHPPEDVSVLLFVEGRPPQPAHLDGFFHRSHAPIFLPVMGSSFAADASEEFGARAPGTATPPVTAGLLIGVGVATALTLWWAGRSRSKR